MVRARHSQHRKDVDPVYTGLPSPRHAKSARYDHHSNRVVCEEGTRKEVLNAVCQWMRPDEPSPMGEAPANESLIISGPKEAPVFWLCGQAGTGKSTIAQTAAEWCDHCKCLGASFFCSRDSSECSNVQFIFLTIAYQLGIRNEAFRKRVAEVLSRDPGVENTSAARQLEKLIVEPLKLVEDFPPYIIIIDALDECKDDDPMSRILCAISRWVPQLRPLKFFITSRPEQNIYQGFRKAEAGVGLIDNTQRLVLHEIPQAVTERDVREYLERKLIEVAAQYATSDVWPTTEQIAALAYEAHGLFIFAATAIKFVRAERSADPEGQLTMLLQSRYPSSSASPFARLDALYLQVLQAAFLDMDDALMAKLKMVVGSLVLILDRLSSTALENLLDLQRGTVQRSLRLLHSLIIVPDSSDEVLQLIHPSFHDFLIDSSRCTDRRIAIDLRLQHTAIGKKCMGILNSLRRDICAIGDSSKLNIEVPDLHRRVADHIPPHLQYACKHWASHLADGDIDEDLFQLLRTFCEQHLLHWLEVMSLLGALGDALQALVSVQATLQVCCRVL